MTQEFKLQPADVLVDINEENDLYSKLDRWALGSPYTHVRLFCGTPYASMPPLFYESIPTKGATFTNAFDSLGQKVVVMRLRPEYQSHKPMVLTEACRIATDPQSRYDFACLPDYILPRLICDKLGIPVPLKYHRDPFMVCSEAVAEPFWRSGLEVLPLDVVPLPGDFVYALTYFQCIDNFEFNLNETR
jgi:hypothetical protein